MMSEETDSYQKNGTIISNGEKMYSFMALK